MANGIVYNWSPLMATGGGGGVSTYANFAAFPASASDGTLALALDTDILYAYNAGGAAWVIIGGPGAALSIGTIDSTTASANGAAILADALIMQSASGTSPGLVNITTQTFAGNKTFSGTIGASNLSGTNTGDLTLAAVGSSPSANGASLSGQVLTIQPADGTHPGVITANTQTIGGGKSFTSATSFAAGSAVTAGLYLATDVGTGLWRAGVDSLGITAAGANVVTIGTSGLSVTGALSASTTVTATTQLISSVSTGTAPLVVSSTTQVANLNAATAGSATSATNATNVATTQVSSSASYFPLMVASSTNGNQACDLATGLTYNPSTNTMTATTFVGALTGNASTATSATTATNATNVATTAKSDNTTYFVPFVGANSSSNQGVDVGPMTYNPSTGALTATSFAGNTAASTITGTTLASNVVTSSLTTVGTIATGVWNGTVVGESYGGTGQNTGLQVLFKNRIINGGMVIDQRNAGAAQTITAAAALAYTVDRWYAYCTGANVTGQQVAGTTASQFVYQFTGAASVTAIGFAQRIEAKNSYDLNNTTVTLSCNISNSLLTTVTWTVYRATTTADTFGTLASPTVTQEATGTWTVSSSKANYSANISLSSSATTGLQILFTVGAQISGTWKIDSVQLEKGSNATNYGPRPYGEELLLCQRYLPCWRGTAASDPFPQVCSAATSSAVSGPITHPTMTRIAPTGVTISAGTDWKLSRPSTGSLTASAISFASAGTTASALQWTVSGATTDQIYYLQSVSSSSLMYMTGCEL